ncbi:Hypothetical protein BRZCDTV_161 [Brazilian cedratvirus IHUMI]|uniref:Uncharacterized protein n=1 Tax=Brazilian cedratvirus IHUMI TaxID=2126980 RepID=A0A2R8FDL8_9VIRU|nr:Hypothetical protein BRZCDTV_161 [Brazilian cedratvirus IHUMI]
MEDYYGKLVVFALHFSHFVEGTPISELETKIAVESERQLIYEIARNVAHLTRFTWVSSSSITERYRTENRNLMGKFVFDKQVIYFTCRELCSTSS